jgi:hypothetical protein
MMPSSYDFERGDPDYLNLANVFQFDDNSWTCCCWVNPESAPAGYSGIISQSDNSALMNLATHDTKFAFWLSGWNDGTTVISTGTWYFLASTFDGGSGSGDLKLYVGTGNQDLAVEATKTVDISLGVSDDIGVAFYRPADIAGYDGLLSHVKIYNRDLSIGELKEVLLNPFSVPKGNIIHLPMTGSDPGKDVSGNGNDFTATGTPVGSTSGPPVSY